MNRPVIKFLSARTGKYEFATVDGLGDIALLQTRIKTDIVSAINELIVEGISGGLTEEDRDRINDIGNSVDSLKNGTFQITEWGSVDEYYQDKLNATIEIINRSNKETIELEKEQVREIIETAISDYEQNVADINVLMESARQNVSNAEDLLAQKAAELETANIDYRELTQVVDVINGVIQDKVQTIDFDLFNAMTTDYQTLVTQTAQKWGVEASLDSLSYMSGRVESNEASLEVQNNMIQGKVGYNEWQYLPVNIGEYNDNLLKYTRDLTEGWERSNTAIYVTSETFQHTKIAAIEQNGAFYYTSNSDDLEVGRTYTASIWVNIQERNKNATDAKYAPNNAIQEVNLMLGTESNATAIHEDLRGVNGWAQHYITFVADESNPRFAPIVKFNHNTQIAYITAPKLEEGTSVTGWQPHVDDDYATIYSSHSLIRQQGNEIATFVNEVKVLDDSYQEATSSFSQLADGFELNTQKIEEYEEAVLEYGSQVKAFNDSFSAKVWENDFQNVVSDINIDNRNRVFNSAFDIIDYNETTRETDIVFWDGNDGKITKLIGEHGTEENHLQLSRTGVQNVNITSMTSNKFKSRYGERLIFSFNSIISGLDSDNIFALEIFDISDVRLFKKEFSLSTLTAEPLANGVVRYSGSYTIAHEDTAKARVVIQLPKNGNININKLLVQGADIGTTDWTPAPEDSQLVRSRQEAEISVLKNEIGLRVTKESIDQSSGLVINEEGNITINPATIIQRVTNVELLGDEALIDGTIFDQKVDGWRQRLVEDGTVINDINASPGLYQINFDRVAIDGELLARMISTYDLDIANGFRLVNGTIPVIAANAVTGEVELNVTKLTINAIPAATQKDLEEIELTPGPKGDKGDAGKDAIAVHIKSPTGTAFEYNAEGQLGSVKQRTIEATYTGTIIGTVYYEFLIDGYSQKNEVSPTFTYQAPSTYAAMPQVVEVRIRQGAKTGTVLASNILTYTGIKPGADGEQGIKGDDGRSQYTHIAYAQSANGVTGFSTSSSVDATYIGMYTSFDSDDSQTPSDYNWSLIKGADGSQGIQGPKGSDGLTPYLHIAYATGPSGEGFSVLEGEDKTYIGVYTDNISADSEDWRKYTWSLIRGPQGEQGPRGLTGAQGSKGDQGIQGAKGADGKPSYTHIAYADTIDGAGFSHNDASKAFIGIYADDQEVSSGTASKYTWSKWHGEDGDQGVQGPQGINGKPSYTHFAYATNETGTTGFSTSDSLNKSYLGIYTDDIETDSSDPSKYKWTLIKGATGAQGPRGIEGLQGPKGEQGIKGAPGENGLSQYTHIAYADNDTGTLRFSLSDSNREYVGMYTDFEPDDSSDASKYKWTLIKGRDGSRGIEGPKGTDGLTPYLHIAYANSADGVAGFSTNNSTNKLYIGTYTDYIEEDPTNPALYSWTLVKGEKGEKGDTGSTGPRGAEGAQGPKGTDGIQGPKGADGKPSYTHIAYADNINGGGFSHNDATKPFIGIYADDQATSSDVVSKYTWSKWHGEDGDQGVQGPKGVDGKPSYTHFAYATNATGTTGFSTTDSLNKTYLGIYTDDVEADSSDPTKYKWTLIKGATGAQGPQGIQGLQGPDGSQGIQGPKGLDGKSQYTHIAYANSEDGTVDFSTSDSNREYVGMYVDDLPNDSTVPSKYKWTLVKGRDGSNGIQGPKGIDGKTQYLHIAYANNATGTVGFSVNDSLNKLYIGTYTDFTEADSQDPTKYSWTLVKGEKGETGPRGLEGLQGNKGDQGIQGPKGDSSYTHIAYATSETGANFNHSTFPTATYIGMYVDNLPGSSSTPSKYQWTLIKGADGSRGIQGPKGTDGLTPYFHTAYATNATGTTGFSTTVSAGKTYIGTYTDYTSEDSSDPTKYKWVLVKGETGEQGPRGAQGIQGPQGNQGIQGPKGIDGKSQYTHIGYATSATGANFSHSTFESATYIGMYVDNTEESSSTPSKYEWTLIKGKDGSQGIQGPKGTDGKTPYFHTAWATSATGAGFSTTISAGKSYIGTYTDYVAADSGNWADYRWTLIKGEKGDQGSQGIQGPKGTDGTSSYTHIAYGTSSTGANFNKTNFADATFIGITTTNSATSPSVASAYTWSEFKGKDGSNGIAGPKGENGLTPYFHQAWADDEDGNGFTLLQKDSIGKKYYGSFWDFTMADSTNRADYTWQPYTDWLRDEIEGVKENFGELAFADKTDLLSGNPIFTDKADENGIVHVGVDGKSYQHAGNGKNVFNDYILSDRSSFQLETYSASPIFQLKPNTTYVISAREIKAPSYGYQLVLNVMNATNGAPIYGDSDYSSKIIRAIFNMPSSHSGFTNFSMPFTTPESGKISFSYFDGMRGKSPEGNWFTDVMLEPQMEEGLVPTEYELPAPSPEYPIEIHSLNDFDVVSSVGKENLILGSGKVLLNGSDHGNRGLAVNKGDYVSIIPIFAGNVHANVIPSTELIKGEEYTLSFEISTNTNVSVYWYAVTGGGVTSGGTIQNTQGEWFRHEFTYTQQRDTFKSAFLWGFSGLVSGSEVRYRNLKLEKGSTTTPYSLSPEDIVEDDNNPIIDKINLLLDKPLRSVGDVKDRLFRDNDGLWKIEQNVGEHIEDGSANWVKGLNGRFDTHSNPLINSRSKDYNYLVSSTHYMYDGGSSAKVNTTWSVGNQLRIVPPNESITGEDVKLFMKNEYDNGNPVIWLYPRVTTIETLDQELQDKLNNLRTFKGSNYVYTVLPDKSNILTPELTATFKSRAWANDHRAQYNASKAMHITDVWYAKGVSNTIAPIIGWSTDAPKWEDGLFIWSKTITTYGDGRTSETDPICITGATGRSVDKIEELYYLSTSATALAGGTWSGTAPTWAEGKYIWTKSKITYKNPAGVEETKPINTTGHRGSVGQPGASGVDAKTVKLNNMIHAVHFNQEGTNPSISSIAFPTSIQGFTGLTPSYEFKQGNTIVRGLETASTWTLNTSSMTYADFPLSITVNVVINGQILASDTATIVATKPGQDAYTVVMANESHTFRGDVSNALAGSTVANVFAYKGATRVGAIIGTITGLPTGMTATIAGNGTTAARVTFTVTTAMVSGSGTVDIPITVDGKAFTKQFNYAIAFKGEVGARGATGATGSTGPRGAEGVSVSSVTEYYLATASDSGVTTATAGWTTTLQTITAAKKHLWNYEVINFSDGTKQPTIPVIIGVYGDKGDSGANGRSVVSITEYYLATTASSGVTRSTSGWTTAMQTTDQSKRYLWNYETITWNVAPLVTYVEPIVIGVEGVNGKDGNNGTNGVAGKDGVGIKTTTINYASSTSGTVTPTTGWQATVPTVAAGNYLWTRTTWTYTDNSVENGYSVARIGKDGNTGNDGNPGKDGVGIKTTVIAYASSTSGTVTPGSGWTAGVPTVAQGNFLWTRTIWTYTDNTTETGYSVARMGQNGSKGDTGSPAITYNWVTSGVTIDAQGGLRKASGVTNWDAQAYTKESFVGGAFLSFKAGPGSGTGNVMIALDQSPDEDSHYNKLDYAYYLNNGTVSIYERNVARGSFGSYVSGDSFQIVYDGESIKYYHNGSLNRQLAAPSGLRLFVDSSFYTVSATNQVTDVYFGPVGAKGSDGVSITAVDVEYYLSTSATALSGGAWNTTAPTWIDGRFMWSRTKTTYSSGNPTYSNPANITGAKGGTGGAGSTGKGITSITEEYYLSTSKTTRSGGSWTTTAPTWSTGKYMWTRSKIVWNNPTSTTYSDPIVDTAWEAVNELEIGGVNLIKGSATPIIMLPRNTGNTTDNFNFIQMQAPMKSGETYTLSFDAEITHGSFSALDIYTQYGHTSTTRHSIVNGRVVATFIAAATTDAPITYIYAGVTSATRGNGLIISNYKLEKGNKPTGWSPAPEDLYQYVDNIEVGSTNLLRDSRTIPISSNNNATYPASITAMEESGRSFSRVRRTNLALQPSVFSIYGTMHIRDINKSIFENESTVVSFKARASQNVTMSTMDTTFGDSQLVTGSLGSINVTTEWKTFYSVFPKIPQSALGFRVNPLNTITSVNMSTFYLDLCEWKIEKGNKPTGWSPAPEDVAVDVNKKTYNPVRYIRDWSNGSTANGGNHWYELMAIDEYGNNIALNRTVTSNGTGSNFNHLTNGVTAIGTFASVSNGGEPVYLEVDLGDIYYNIAEIKVWKYYNDGRTYNENKTEVSPNGVTWYPIYDYTVEGEYTPTEQGKSIPNTIAKTHSILTATGTKNIIDKKADGSTTESSLNEAAAKLQVLQQEVEAAATANELNDFIDKYNKDMASRDSAARESESSLSSALTSITSIQNNLGDMSETWTFIDRFIKNTPQGVVVGNDSSGSYILIKEDRLSFYSNGQEVAFISQNLMEISRGAFVEQIQIAKYQFEESTTNHLTVRFVG